MDNILKPDFKRLDSVQKASSRDIELTREIAGLVELRDKCDAAINEAVAAAEAKVKALIANRAHIYAALVSANGELQRVRSEEGRLDA